MDTFDPLQKQEPEKDAANPERKVSEFASTVDFELSHPRHGEDETVTTAVERSATDQPVSSERVDTVEYHAENTTDEDATDEDATAQDVAAEEASGQPEELISGQEEAADEEPLAATAVDEEAVEDEQAAEEDEEVIDLKWYVLRVQVNREPTIRDALMRRFKIANVEKYVDDILVPTEKVAELKNGKKKIVERRLYPGYVMAHIDLNDDVWYAIREVRGVGDFISSGGKPLPMTASDIAKMFPAAVAVEGESGSGVAEAAPKLRIPYEKDDRVKILNGTFENFEGVVEEIVEAKGLVRVTIQIFGRPTPVELDYKQLEKV